MKSIWMIFPALFAGTAWAEVSGISLSQTRIVFNADDRAQTLTVRNRSEQNFLLQSLALMTPDGTEAAPFIVTPPLFRLAAGSEQTLRILPHGEFPNARQESLYYLAVNAIPASKQSDAAMQVSMGMRFNLKLIYRPAGLDALSGAQTCRLRFSQSAQQLTVSNPTPFYVTLGRLTLDGKDVDLRQQQLMLPPGGSHPLSAPATTRHAGWQAINDHGGSFPLCQTSINPTAEKS